MSQNAFVDIFINLTHAINSALNAIEDLLKFLVDSIVVTIEIIPVLSSNIDIFYYLIPAILIVWVASMVLKDIASD